MKVTPIPDGMADRQWLIRGFLFGVAPHDPVTLVGVGNCFVTANQLGNTNYSDATPVTGTIAVAAVGGIPPTRTTRASSGRRDPI